MCTVVVAPGASAKIDAIREARQRNDSYFGDVPRDIIESVLVPMVAAPPSPCRLKAAVPEWRRREGDRKELLLCVSCFVRKPPSPSFYNGSIACMGCNAVFVGCPAHVGGNHCGFAYFDSGNCYRLCRWCSAEGRFDGVHETKANQLQWHCGWLKGNPRYQAIDGWVQHHLGHNIQSVLKASSEQAVCDYSRFSPSQYDELVDTALSMVKAAMGRLKD
jgi:hypothetical protein